MNHVVVTWNSQGFRLGQDDPIFTYLSTFTNDTNVQYLTVCLQETGNLYTPPRKLSTQMALQQALKKDTNGNESYHYTSQVGLTLCGRPGFTLYYYYWKAQTGGNARCSMAIISNLPGVQFANVPPPSSVNSTQYRPVLCATSNIASVYNLHAAAVGTEPDKPGRPFNMLEELEDRYAISGDPIPPYQVVTGDFNLNCYSLRAEYNETGTQLSQMGFDVYPPNACTQGPYTSTSDSTQVHNLINYYDYAAVRGATPNCNWGFVEEIGSSDHLPVAYIFPVTDTEMS